MTDARFEPGSLIPDCVLHWSRTSAALLLHWLCSRPPCPGAPGKVACGCCRHHLILSAKPDSAGLNQFSSAPPVPPGLLLLTHLAEGEGLPEKAPPTIAAASTLAHGYQSCHSVRKDITTAHTTLMWLNLAEFSTGVGRLSLPNFEALSFP